MESVPVATYCPQLWWPCFRKEVTQAGKVEVIGMGLNRHK